MKMTIDKLVSCHSSIAKLVNLPFPPKLSFQLSKWAEKVQAELKHIEIQRNKLKEKYGKKTEMEPKPNIQKSDPESQNAFWKEWHEFCLEVVEIDDITIYIDDIPDQSAENKNSLTPMDFASLSDFILQSPVPGRKT